MPSDGIDVGNSMICHESPDGAHSVAGVPTEPDDARRLADAINREFPGLLFVDLILELLRAGGFDAQTSMSCSDGVYIEAQRSSYELLDCLYTVLVLPPSVKAEAQDVERLGQQVCSEPPRSGLLVSLGHPIGRDAAESLSSVYPVAIMGAYEFINETVKVYKELPESTRDKLRCLEEWRTLPPLAPEKRIDRVG